MKKITLTFLLLVLFLPSFPLWAKDTFKETPAKQNIRYSVEGALGYRSMLYIDGENTESENFFTVSFLGTYYPLSFLSITGELGLGFLPLYDNSHLDTSHIADFLTDVTRVSFFTSVSADFFFFANADNMLYLGLGLEYEYLPNFSNASSYSGESRNLTGTSSNVGSVKITLGDRFALFSHVIMDANISFYIPFTTVYAPGTNHKYGSFTIMFSLGFGYFN